MTISSLDFVFQDTVCYTNEYVTGIHTDEVLAAFVTLVINIA